VKYNYRTAAGKPFTWDSKNNHILDTDGDRLDIGNKIQQCSHGVVFPSTKQTPNPSTIKIILGHACNYDCSYCMQKDLGDPTERKRNHKLEGMFAALDKQVEQVQQFQLWGGEPLLYWADCKAFIERYDKEGVDWLIVTNGSLLRNKHIDYFDAMVGNAIIVISHDGPAQLTLRGVDPLDKERTIQTLQYADKLGVGYNFNCVLTQDNYDVVAIEDWFTEAYTKHGLQMGMLSLTVGLSYEMDYGSGSAAYVIQGNTLTLFKESIRRAIKRHSDNMWFDPTGRPQWDSSRVAGYYFSGKGTASVLETAFKAASGAIVPRYHACGANHPQVISLDMDTNVRPCPHVGKAFNSGTLDSLPDVELKQVVERTSCHECRVYSLCQGGCPLNLHAAHFRLNCDVQKAWYGEILDAALEFLLKEPVRRVDNTIQMVNLT